MNTLQSKRHPLFCNVCDEYHDGGYPYLTIIEPGCDPVEEWIHIVDGGIDILGSYWSDGELYAPSRPCWVYNGWQFTAEKDGNSYILGDFTHVTDLICLRTVSLRHMRLPISFHNPDYLKPVSLPVLYFSNNG